jgi:hypothetical protein
MFMWTLFVPIFSFFLNFLSCFELSRFFQKLYGWNSYQQPLLVTRELGLDHQQWLTGSTIAAGMYQQRLIAPRIVATVANINCCYTQNESVATSPDYIGDGTFSVVSSSSRRGVEDHPTVASMQHRWWSCTPPSGNNNDEVHLRRLSWLANPSPNPNRTGSRERETNQGERRGRSGRGRHRGHLLEASDWGRTATLSDLRRRRSAAMGARHVGGLVEAWRLQVCWQRLRWRRGGNGVGASGVGFKPNKYACDLYQQGCIQASLINLDLARKLWTNQLWSDNDCKKKLHAK